MWKWRSDDGFLCGRFELPMGHGGAVVESFFDVVAERRKPATGEAWEPLERRQADILLALCQMEADSHGRDEESRGQEATVGARVDVHVDIPLHGPATMCGMPLPDEWVAAARANARVHLRVCDNGNVIHEERARSFVSPKRRRAVVRRDGRCRWPGCEHRLRLQVHHLHPSSWGGPDDSSNLAAVCPYHHGLLIPHGDHVLDGNPNQPDGLTLRTITKEERERRRIEGMILAVCREQRSLTTEEWASALRRSAEPVDGEGEAFVERGPGLPAEVDRSAAGVEARVLELAHARGRHVRGFGVARECGEPVVEVVDGGGDAGADVHQQAAALLGGAHEGVDRVVDVEVVA